MSITDVSVEASKDIPAPDFALFSTNFVLEIFSDLTRSAWSPPPEASLASLPTKLAPLMTISSDLCPMQVRDDS